MGIIHAHHHLHVFVTRVFGSKLRKIEKTGNYDLFKIRFDERWKLRYFVFLLPFFLEFLCFYSLCNFPIISVENVAISCFYGTLLFLNLDYLLPKNSPSYFGHVVAAVFFHWAVYVIHYKPCSFLSFLFPSSFKYINNKTLPFFFPSLLYPSFLPLPFASVSLPSLSSLLFRLLAYLPSLSPLLFLPFFRFSSLSSSLPFPLFFTLSFPITSRFYSLPRLPFSFPWDYFSIYIFSEFSERIINYQTFTHALPSINRKKEIN